MSFIDQTAARQGQNHLGARHARLFELIRRRNLASTARRETDPHKPEPAKLSPVTHKSLNRDEQHALGIMPSFGR